MESLARTNGGLIEGGGGTSTGLKGRAKIREGKGMSVESRWRSGKVEQEGMLGLGGSEYGVVLLTAFFFV